MKMGILPEKVLTNSSLLLRPFWRLTFVFTISFVLELAMFFPYNKFFQKFKKFRKTNLIFFEIFFI